LTAHLEWTALTKSISLCKINRRATLTPPVSLGKIIPRAIGCIDCMHAVECIDCALGGGMHWLRLYLSIKSSVELH
jgi:hypothetical protein